MDIKQEMSKRLREDCKTLLDVKIPKALENISDEKGVNTYRNLTKALADNIKLIEEYDWQLMHSEYTDVTDESNPKKQVAVWEQNSDGEIRNHKVWNVENTINTKYIDFENQILSLIKHFSVDDKIIIPTSEAVRGVGKTTFLVKQAVENNGIYIGKNKVSVKIAESIAHDVFRKPLNTISFGEGIDMEHRLSIVKELYDKMLYIDEGVDLDKIDLDGNKYIAFKYYFLNNN